STRLTKPQFMEAPSLSLRRHRVHPSIPNPGIKWDAPGETKRNQRVKSIGNERRDHTTGGPPKKSGPPETSGRASSVPWGAGGRGLRSNRAARPDWRGRVARICAGGPPPRPGPPSTPARHRDASVSGRIQVPDEARP